METDYEKFCEVVNSAKTQRRLDSADGGNEIQSFQMYGFSADMVEEFLEKFVLENPKWDDVFYSDAAAIFKKKEL